ncbi:MAG: hypothetical protein WD576_01460 [Nitriliruptoraceae bacterium]
MPDRSSRVPLGASPFGHAAPSIILAVLFMAATIVWAVVDVLPGGRWFAVHLFTLGVLTNAVLTFSDHFSRTLTRWPGERAWWWPLPINGAIVTMLVGMQLAGRWVFAIGATGVLTVVLMSYWRIRTMRKRALGPRFGWVVRMYERAHGAFVHGALLGILLGIGVVAGPWYGTARLAHLHINIFGWGGLTLLATLVFFGPSMARTRIEPGADARAAKALRIGATALTVAVVALLLSAFAGTAGVVFRLLAALMFAGFGWAVLVVCIPLVRAVCSARRSAQQPLIVAVAFWFGGAAIADVVVIATAQWAWLDAIGAMMLAGVLAQAILATLIYLTPMLRGRTAQARDIMRDRLDRAALVRAVAFNAGVVALVLAAVPNGVAAATVAGWLLVATTITTTGAIALSPLKAVDRPVDAPAADHQPSRQDA